MTHVKRNISVQVLTGLKSVSSNFLTERDRLKAAIEVESGLQSMSLGVSPAIVASLKANLNQALQQNTELKSRLMKVHDVSDLTDLSSLDPVSDTVRI